jgi:excisionase family DNA binding protein
MVNKNNKNSEYLSTAETANLLNISRIAVHKKIKSGDIPAEKVGRNYIIHKEDLSPVLKEKISPAEKKFITDTVSRVTSEYGELLEKLSKE